MGRGIAQVAAQAGYATTLHDADADSLGRSRGAIEVSLARGVETAANTTVNASRWLKICFRITPAPRLAPSRSANDEPRKIERQ